MAKFNRWSVYRIFSIKRQVRLFRTRPRRPGVYLGPGIYLLNAFFSIGGLLNQEPNFNKNVKKNVKQSHQHCLVEVNLVSYLPKKKKTSLTETVIELFSMLRFSVHKTRRKCIGNCSTANILCKQFTTRWWRASFSISSEKRQNHGTIQLQGTAGEMLETPLRWSLFDVQARQKVSMI